MYKAFDQSGLTALTSHIKSTKQTADASSSAVAELEGDFQTLVQQVANCLTELDDVKADIAGFGVCNATVE
jgi:phage shock protein A